MGLKLLFWVLFCGSFYLISAEDRCLTSTTLRQKEVKVVQRTQQSKSLSQLILDVESFLLQDYREVETEVISNRSSLFHLILKYKVNAAAIKFLNALSRMEQNQKETLLSVSLRAVTNSGQVLSEISFPKDNFLRDNKGLPDQLLLLDIETYTLKELLSEVNQVENVLKKEKNLYEDSLYYLSLESMFVDQLLLAESKGAAEYLQDLLLSEFKVRTYEDYLALIYLSFVLADQLKPYFSEMKKGFSDESKVENEAFFAQKITEPFFQLIKTKSRGRQLKPFMRKWMKLFLKSPLVKVASSHQSFNSSGNFEVTFSRERVAEGSLGLPSFAVDELIAKTSERDLLNYIYEALFLKNKFNYVFSDLVNGKTAAWRLYAPLFQKFQRVRAENSQMFANRSLLEALLGGVNAVHDEKEGLGRLIHRGILYRLQQRESQSSNRINANHIAKAEMEKKVSLVNDQQVKPSRRKKKRKRSVLSVDLEAVVGAENFNLDLNDALLENEVATVVYKGQAKKVISSKKQKNVHLVQGLILEVEKLSKDPYFYGEMKESASHDIRFRRFRASNKQYRFAFTYDEKDNIITILYVEARDKIYKTTFFKSLLSKSFDLK